MPAGRETIMPEWPSSSRSAEAGSLRAPAAAHSLRVYVVLGLALLASCGRFDRANAARAKEIEKLSHETFAQAAEEGRCLNVSCAREEAGFAYAKAHNVQNPDGCVGKGDDAFVEGCRQYGENIEAAYHRLAVDG